MAAARKLILVDELLSEDDDYLWSTNPREDFMQIINVGIAHIVERKDKHRLEEFSELVLHYSLDEFTTMFKISRGTVQQLYEYICQVVAQHDIPGLLPGVPGGRPQVPLQNKVLLTLWFITGQEPYTRLADRFNVSESTACDATRIIIQVIHNYLTSKFIRWPSHDELQEISSLFEELHNFPGVNGFIDATHIPIKPPEEQRQNYYNRKDFYSVLLQAVVREDLTFTDIYCGWPGRVHDARVLRNSPLYMHHERLILANCHILGDNGYPCLPWLLSPFVDNGHLTRQQVKYNKVHSRMRSTVERAFGVLKCRFKRLKYIHKGDMQDTNQCIVAACVLHNLCIYNGDEIEEYFQQDDMEINAIPEHMFPDNQRTDGALKRLTIARALP